MKNTLFYMAALFLVLGGFFLSAQTAHAAAFTLPQQFSYAGLTFIQPLTYDAPTKQMHIQTETLTFSTPEKLAVAHTDVDSTKVDTDLVLLPTITIAMTLPVLPSQTPPAAFQTEEEADTPTPTTKAQSTTKTAVAGVSAFAAASAAPTPIQSGQPVTTAPANTGGGLDAEKLFAMSNAYRQAQGLPAFQKDERACSLAASRAPEINGEIASGTMHSGLRARALPYWNSENIISMHSEEAAFNWWVNDKIHHDAIVGNYTYSCVACSGNACAQEFTNFQSK